MRQTKNKYNDLTPAYLKNYYPTKEWMARYINEVYR